MDKTSNIICLLSGLLWLSASSHINRWLWETASTTYLLKLTSKVKFGVAVWLRHWRRAVALQLPDDDPFTAGGAGPAAPATWHAPLWQAGEGWTQCCPTSTERQKIQLMLGTPVGKYSQKASGWITLRYLERWVVLPWWRRSKRRPSSPACSRSETPDTRGGQNQISISWRDGRSPPVLTLMTNPDSVLVFWIIHYLVLVIF